MNTIDFKHTLTNKLLMIQCLVQNLHENLPILIETYSRTPENVRAGDISNDILDTLPKMVEYSLTALQQVRSALHDLEEPHHD